MYHPTRQGDHLRMNTTPSRPWAGGAFALLLLGGCGAAVPAATQEAGSSPQPRATQTPVAERAFTDADVQFMQHMMVHHAQAVEMTALVPERASQPDLLLMAERIAVSQTDEMAQMVSWLRSRGQAVPGPHAHHGLDHAGMPGMQSPEQMARLEASRGPLFDRLFLEMMIDHHEGALVMVEALLGTDGAAQETDTYTFVSHVDSDQRIEIERMRRMLDAPSPGAGPR
jgi:uncharacterized protein (DUF305 family)